MNRFADRWHGYHFVVLLSKGLNNGVAATKRFLLLITVVFCIYLFIYSLLLTFLYNILKFILAIGEIFFKTKIFVNRISINFAPTHFQGRYTPQNQQLSADTLTGRSELATKCTWKAVLRVWVV